MKLHGTVRVRRWPVGLRAGIAAGALLGSCLTGGSVRAAEATAPVGRWEPEPPTYGVGSATGVPFITSDGTRLVTDIYFPVDRESGERVQGETFPVLITQNPYFVPFTNFKELALYFVSRGYIYVVEDVRGTQRSSGVYELFGTRQALDGVELVNWAAHDLAGSNGVVGLEGVSYLAINQIMTAAASGPNSPLKAIAPVYGTDDVYREPEMTGGMPTQFWAVYQGLQASDYVPSSSTPQLADPYDAAALLSGRAWSAQTNALGLTAEALAGGPRAYAGGWWSEPGRARSLAAEVANSGVAVLLVSGSHDIFPAVQFRLFSQLQSVAQGGPASGPMATTGSADPRYQIVFGDYGHGDHAFDPSFLAMKLEWYDTWLKGEPTGLQDITNPVHIFDERANGWANLPSFPITSSYTSYYLTPDRSLTPSPPAATGDSTIIWAPQDVPGSSVTFTTQPFTDAVTLAGPMSATLYAASTTAECQLSIHLDDVAPDGTVSGISGGALIGSLRAVDAARSWYDERGLVVYPHHPFTQESAQPVPIGKVVRYDIELPPRMWTLQPGHRLRLTVQTQAPSMPNTAGGGFLTTAAQTATLGGGSYRLVLGGASPSALVLPILPESAFHLHSEADAVPKDWTTPGL
jgi:hypothetical protein